MKRIFPILVLLAAFCASGPDQPNVPTALKAGNYTADTGPSPVGVIPTAMLHDAQRNKDVDISIEYPTRGGPFPVIVFSHGYGGTNQSYEPLISYWTSNGYVCIRPAHADSGKLAQVMREMNAGRREQGQSQQGRRGATPQPQMQTAPPPPRPKNPMEDIWDKEREPQWRDRVADLKLVIDSLDQLERRFPELKGKMDHAQIGAGGHSYGAFTAMLIAGMQTFGNPPLQLADPRVKAFIAMSPQGVASNRGTTAQSWAEVHTPALYMTGSNDRGAAEGEDAHWRKQAFDNSPSGEKYFVLIQGANHMSFTGATGFSSDSGYQRPIATSTSTFGGSQGGATFASPGRRTFEIIKVTSLAYWDAVLKHDTTARDLLEPQKYSAAFSGAEISAK